jgi:DNA invertase Pin-like site-specific DNA recombinase
MPRKKYAAEPIIRKLKEAAIRLGQGETLNQVLRELAISEQTFYRWLKELRSLRLSQAQRLKKLERENELLRRLMADLSDANRRQPSRIAR